MFKVRESHLFFLVVLILSGIWIYLSDLRALIPTDEGRYAEMAREMLATGDWITLRLNGIKYFEKPPLQIWMTAMSFKLFGLGEWQARLWSSLCGLFSIGFIGLTGLRIYSARIGLFAGLVLASCLIWNAMAHINTLDMGLAAMMTLSLCSLLLSQHAPKSIHEQRHWMLLCWAGMALAVLSKGLVGIVLPGFVLIAYSILCRDMGIWKRLHWRIGVAIFFAITAPWFILVSLKNPEFPSFFFIHEHFQRYLTTIHHRTETWYFFIPVLLFGLLPWLTFLPRSIWRAWRHTRKVFQTEKILFIWVVFIFIFFSLSHSKLISYILPIFPALALLIARNLERISLRSWYLVAGLLVLLGIAGCILAPAIPSLTADAVEALNYRQAIPWIFAASVFALLVGLALIGIIRNPALDHPLYATLLVALAGWCCGTCLLLSTQAQGYYRSGLPLVQAIQNELTRDTHLYMVGMYDHTLPFYLRRTMTLVKHQDEMAFGLQLEPQLWVPTYDEFMQRWHTEPKIIAIMQPGTFQEFQRQGLSMRVIARDTRRVIVSNLMTRNPS